MKTKEIKPKKLSKDQPHVNYKKIKYNPLISRRNQEK